MSPTALMLFEVVALQKIGYRKLFLVVWIWQSISVFAYERPLPFLPARLPI